MGNILNKILSRPFYFWKYIIQTIGFTLNYFLISIQASIQGNFKIGSNPRVLSFNAFKAEKPSANITIGDSLILYKNCDLMSSGSGCIKIGNNCIIGSNLRLYCRQDIQIGDNTLISWNVFISDYDAHSINPDERLLEINQIQTTFIPNFKKNKHNITGIQDYEPTYKARPVLIGDNVWIGANAIILKGVSIGSGSVIAAGSVVTKNIPANSVAAGNPASVIKKIVK